MIAALLWWKRVEEEEGTLELGGVDFDWGLEGLVGWAVVVLLWDSGSLLSASPQMSFCLARPGFWLGLGGDFGEASEASRAFALHYPPSPQLLALLSFAAESQLQLSEAQGPVRTPLLSFAWGAHSLGFSGTFSPSL